MHLRLLRPFASLCLAGLALSAVVSAQPAAARLAVAVDRQAAVLARLADDWRVGVNVPGLSAAVVQGDQIVWAEGFGAADVEQAAPARPESVFRLASISKPITAVAVMQLVERGLVSLDDPIQKYVPSFPRKIQGEVRIHHLLAHTSGIRHYRGNEFGLAAPFPTLESALGVFRNDPLEFAPGERYLYSTFGYSLLQGVVENVSGRSFEEYLRSAIFGPAGMTSTWLEHPQEIVRFRARQYVHGATPLSWLNAPYVDLSVKWAGGGLIATASDIARFDIALNYGKLLRPETLERMYTAGRLNNGARMGYGLGWMLSQQGSRQLVAHSGGAMGGTTYVLREPRARTASVVFVNLDNVPRLRELAEQLMALAPDPLPVSTR
ncbi:MAG: beta-lactamase family protein [Acidobacteria bacterium]|nr:beta-lactamase family protein [Acidobacteriota bacterium]